MDRLVADLLEFARVSFGDAIKVQRVATDLGRLVTDVVAEVRASFLTVSSSARRLVSFAASGMRTVSSRHSSTC